MSKVDAERALAIYKTFTKQTNLVVEFLSTARHFENATRLEIPKLKHAPTSLTASLEEYLNDPDFEINRRQYLAQQDGRSGRKKSAIDGAGQSAFKSQPVSKGTTQTGFPEVTPAQTTAQVTEPVKPASKSPAPDLIDFFDSIEQNQTTMATQSQQQAPQYQPAATFQQPQHQAQLMTFPPQSAQQIFDQSQAHQTGFGLQQAQPTGFAPVQVFNTQNGQQMQSPAQTGGFAGNSNPFGQPQAQQPVQSTFTATGFSGYTQQPQPQQQQQDIFAMPQNQGVAFTPQQQPINSGEQYFAPTQQANNTGSQDSNPFRKSMFPQATGGPSPFQSSTPPVSTPLSPQSTNPFARSMTGQSSNSPFTSPPPSMPQGTPFTSPPPPIPQSEPVQQLTPQRTGTNPFSRQPQATGFQTQNQNPSPLVANQTGGNNPFRQSVFHNQQTGQGWQSNQGTMGGLEQMDTVSVFPRPGQPQQQQQQAQPNFFS